MKNTKDAYLFVLKLFLLSSVLILITTVFGILSRNLIQNNATSEASIENDQRITVILDAGHGGIDSGANVGEVFEKNLNLQIVQEIERFIKLYDVDVVLTRTSDSLLADIDSKNKKREDLLNRVKVANEYESPVFISIHMNKFPQSKYKGLQVFYSNNNPYSEALALKLQSNNKLLLEPYNERSVKRAGTSIYVLDRLRCPAVMIECGFISNEDDIQKLSDTNYQKKLAFVIASTIIEYLGL